MDSKVYDLYISLMQPFDLFLWSGKGGFSDVIKTVTKSAYSHASIGIWMQPIIGCPPRFFNAESTTLGNVPDALTGEITKGVQIVNFHQKIESYEGEGLWWFPIKDPFSEEEKLDMMNWLLEKHSSRTEYDLSQGIDAVATDQDTPFWLRVLATPLASMINGKENFSKLFCSELVCKLYKIGNRISEDVNASSITPNELLDFPIYKDPINLYA